MAFSSPLRASSVAATSAAVAGPSPVRAGTAAALLTARPTYQPPPTAYPYTPHPTALPTGYVETYGHLPASLEASPIHPPGGRQVYRATDYASMGASMAASPLRPSAAAKVEERYARHTAGADWSVLEVGMEALAPSHVEYTQLTDSDVLILPAAFPVVCAARANEHRLAR